MISLKLNECILKHTVIKFLCDTEETLCINVTIQIESRWAMVPTSSHIKWFLRERFQEKPIRRKCFLQCWVGTMLTGLECPWFLFVRVPQGQCTPEQTPNNWQTKHSNCSNNQKSQEACVRMISNFVQRVQICLQRQCPFRVCFRQKMTYAQWSK